jgi:L-alanine-DL-glutamate epimerase-like enolase superfamily enzyme
MPALGRPSARYTQMLAPSDFRRVEKGFDNVRDALGEIDIIAHCHSEFDLPSAVGVAKAVAPVRPRWIEDALPVPYSDSWLALKRQSPVPILNGEKLELPRGFLPFLQNQALDVVHPDLAFCGGITSAKKIADIASLYRIPVATHNVGSLVLLMASIHFGAGIFDYVMSETRSTRDNTSNRWG